MLYNALGRCLLEGAGPTQMLLDRGSTFFLTFFLVRIFFSEWLRGRPMAMQFNLHTEPDCFGAFCLASIFFIILEIFPDFPVVAFAIAGS